MTFIQKLESKLNFLICNLNEEVKIIKIRIKSEITN